LGPLVQLITDASTIGLGSGVTWATPAWAAVGLLGRVAQLLFARQLNGARHSLDQAELVARHGGVTPVGYSGTRCGDIRSAPVSIVGTFPGAGRPFWNAGGEMMRKSWDRAFSSPLLSGLGWSRSRRRQARQLRGPRRWR
jgi:hypothetical protein